MDLVWGLGVILQVPSCVGGFGASLLWGFGLLFRRSVC